MTPRRLLPWLLLPSTALAAERIEVCESGCDATNIADAVALAADSDVIVLHPGEYSANISLARPLNFESLGGPEVTVWDVSGDGQLQITQGGRVHVTGIHFRGAGAGSTLRDGRAVTVNDAVLHLSRVILSDISSSVRGPGVAAFSSTLTITGLEAHDLSSTSTGGALYALDSSLTVSDSELWGNSASRGGAIYLETTTSTLTRVHLHDNDATEPNQLRVRGGAVYAVGGALSVVDSTFVGNAAGEGGHLAAADGSLSVSRSRLAEGTADDGGAVWTSSTLLTVDEGLLEDNVASGDGGAVYIDESPAGVVDIAGARFRRNEAGGSGGGMRVWGGVDDCFVSLTDSAFTHNTAVSGGGGVAGRRVDSVEVARTHFISNEVTGTGSGGGGMRFENSGALELIDSFLCDNSAGAGGALSFDGNGDNAEITGVAFAHNSALTTGGGMVLDNTDLEIRFSTFADNSAPTIGPAAVLRGGSFDIERNIVTPTETLGALFTTDSFDSTHSDANLWWTSLIGAYGGTADTDDLLGPRDAVGDPRFAALSAELTCPSIDLTPAGDGAAHDILDDGPVGVTGRETMFRDADDDGFLTPYDCDDSDASVHPDAIEHCNGIDDDCDGLVDDVEPSVPSADTLAIYRDSDGDTYGAELVGYGCAAYGLYTVTPGDCDDHLSTTRPGAADTWYDGVDSNCDEADDFDQDRDGAPLFDAEGLVFDCDDTNPNVSPLIDETWYDGVDSNCDGADDFDQDGDGWPIDGDRPDCDDTNPSVHPDAEDTWYDGVDSNCDGADDFDQDGDGSQVDADCDDTDASVFPGADDAWYDGVDSDCDGANDFDQDEDGYELANAINQPEEPDCDDTDATIHPGAEDLADDGIDQDCNGFDLVDEDGDGFASDQFGGPDCNDADADIHPDAEDIPYNGIDEDCDGSDLIDVDGDGFAASDAGGDDCDDNNADIHPDADEVWYDGVDSNCDGASDFDQDGDGFTEDDGDCDDTDAERYPGAREPFGSAVDLNCDGSLPVSRITGTGCSQLPAPPAAWLLLAPLAALLRRRR